MRDRAREILKPLAPDLPVTAKAGSLGMAERQVVEIARTLARGGRIIAFDEPTSSLTPAERDGLFATIRSLKAQGKGIVYISHRMPEIYEIADRITILRDGRVVASGAPGSFKPDELNTLIAGRKLALALRHERPERRLDGPEALGLDGLVTNKLRGIDLSLRRGEIFGLAGLVGSGRTELVRAVFGADPHRAGRIRVDGKPVAIRSPADAQAAGIALIPEDRRGQALVPMMDVERNFGLASYPAFTRFGVLRGGRRRREAERFIEELAIRPQRTGARIRDLSGGNQQKVVIARWLRSGARIFLFDEPTRGIDVGAKTEIHALLRRLADGGSTVLVISSELPELLMLADRIGVMHEGRLIRILDNDAGLTEDRLIRATAGETAP
jgi:ABC-type sugar transport system ATPase subunit